MALTSVIMKFLVQQVLSCLLLFACRVNYSDAVHTSLHWALARLLFLHQSPVWRVWLRFHSKHLWARRGCWNDAHAFLSGLWIFLTGNGCMWEQNPASLFASTWKGFTLSSPIVPRSKWLHLWRSFNQADVNSSNMSHWEDGVPIITLI